MPEFEVYTTGGGYYVQDLMVYLAAFTSGNMFNDMLLFGITVGVIFMAIRMALTGQMKGMWQYFVLVAVMGGLNGVKARVIVMDSTYPLEIYGAVDNVPYPVAAFASLTTSTSYNLTRRMETLLSSPDSLTYQRHGMLFGATLMSQAARWKAVTPSVHNNLVNFMENCMIDGANIGLLDLDDLARTGDLPALISASAPGALAYYDEDTDTTVRCSDGWAGLENQLDAEVNRVFQTQAAAQRSTTGINAGVVDLAGLTGTLTDFQNMIGMAGYDATRYLKQSMLILAIDGAADRLIANSGNSSAMALYQAARAEQQTRASYQAVGNNAIKWVPLIKIAFETLYYGAFPIAMMLAMTPLAMTVIKGYFSGYVWLAAWEPLSAILHTTMIKASAGYYREHTTVFSGTTPQDVLSWANHFGVQSVEQEVGAVAGFLMMSIPFLSFAIFLGANRMAGLATSMLNVSQGAAIDTGREAATGSISLGNSAMNNFSANKWNTSQVRDAGRTSTTLRDGGVVTTNADGSQTYSAGTAQSNVGLSGSLGSSVRAEVGERLSDAKRRVSTQSEDFARSVSETSTQLSDFVRSVQESQTAGAGVSTTFSDDERRDFNQAVREVETFARNHNLSTDVALDAMISGGLAGKLGTPAGAASANLFARLQASGRIDAKDSIAFNEAFNAAYENSSSTTISSLISAQDRAYADTSAGRSDNASNAMRQSWDQAQSNAVRLTDAYEQSQSLENTQGILRSQDAAFSSRITDAFIGQLSAAGYSDQQISRLVNPKTAAGIARQREHVDQYLPQLLRDLGFPIALQGQGPSAAGLARDPSLPAPARFDHSAAAANIQRPQYGDFDALNTHARALNDQNQEQTFQNGVQGQQSVDRDAAARRGVIEDAAAQNVGPALFDRAAGIMGMGDGPPPAVAPPAGMPSSNALRGAPVPGAVSPAAGTPLRIGTAPAGLPQPTGGIDANGYYRSPYIQYNLDGKVRDDPVDPAIMARLSGIARNMSAQSDAEYGIVVTSGGQAPHGVEGVDRTGSHRHDNGQAVDFFLIKDGRRIVPAEDREAYATLITEASRDFDGIGHYPWGVHVGHGTPAFWGPDRTSASADPYFRDAYQKGRN